MRKKKWAETELVDAAKKSTSLRQVLMALNLRAAGGNYTHIQRALKELKIDTSHFRGRAWRRGMPKAVIPAKSLEEILVENSTYQSYKLKRRLFEEGLKQPFCEQCGWAEKSIDGRLPLELDHINGVRTDNRLENLRILCPNCHSLQLTHRGRNIRT